MLRGSDLSCSLRKVLPPFSNTIKFKNLSWYPCIIIKWSTLLGSFTEDGEIIPEEYTTAKLFTVEGHDYKVLANKEE